MKVCCGARAPDQVSPQLSVQRLSSYGYERYRDTNRANYQLYTPHDLDDGCRAALFEHDIVIVECDAPCGPSDEASALAEQLSERASAAAARAYGPHLRTLWTARWLELEESERTVQAERVREWLRASIRPEDAEELIDGRKDVSMTWLNYVLVENERAERYREAMRLAQYHYAVVDQINVALIDLVGRMAPGASGGGNVDDYAARRSQLEMQATMQNVSLQEDLRAVSREEKKTLNEILQVWEFDALKSVTRDLLKVCGDLIEAKVAQKARSSGLITEIILVAIGAIAVVEVALSLAFSSRSMATDPRLLLNEPALPWTARWFSDTSLDVIMFGALGCIVLLVGLYGLFKRRHR